MGIFLELSVFAQEFVEQRKVNLIKPVFLNILLKKMISLFLT